MIDSHLCTLPASSTRCSETVLNPQGEKIGKVIDFRVDLENRSIVYVVVSLNNVHGMEDRLCALPWKALQLNPRTLSFVLDIEGEVLQHAPCIDPGNWLGQSDCDFINHIYTHYGYDPYYDETGHIQQQSAGIKI